MHGWHGLPVTADGALGLPQLALVVLGPVAKAAAAAARALQPYSMYCQTEVLGMQSM